MTALSERELTPDATAPAEPSLERATYGDRVFKALLTLAAQEAYDLLVMGCYGHSQFRELFLGGVTRHVLQNATMSVLMAH